MSNKFVYVFGQSKTEGAADMKNLLGGKGANLAEMHNMGIPVPPTFVITTEACKAYLAHGSEPDELSREIDDHIRQIEQENGKQA